MFAQPIVGRIVTVTTEHHNIKCAAPVRYTNVGKVLPSQKLDKPDTFRIATDRYRFPEALISLENVVEMSYENGAKIEKRQASPTLEVKKFRVKSTSKNGGFHIVSVAGAKYHCDCKGYEFRRHCQHINKVVEYNKK
jgi:hypothetical protein